MQTHRGTPELFALVYAPTPEQLAVVVPQGSRRRQRERVVDRAEVAAPVRPKPLGLKVRGRRARAAWRGRTRQD